VAITEINNTLWPRQSVDNEVDDNDDYDDDKYSYSNIQLSLESTLAVCTIRKQLLGEMSFR